MKRLALVLCVLSWTATAFAQSAALTRANYARDADIQKRVAFLAVKVSIDVMEENPDTCCGATTEVSNAQHAKRARMAAVTLRDPESIAFRVALAVLTVTSITLASTDAEVETVIRDQWDAYAEAMSR